MPSSEQVHNQVPPNVGADIEKGGSTPRLAPYPSYQATYCVQEAPLVAAPRSGARRARVRFLHAFILAALLFFLLPLKGLRRARQAMFHWRGNGDHYAMSPGLDRPCGLPASWTFDPEDRIPQDHFAHIAETSFELPVASEAFSFLARGSLINGIIDIDAEDTGSDVVKVDILGSYNDVDDFLQLTRVCQFEPMNGRNGVGIFGPEHWSGPQTRFRARFDVRVRLPASRASPLTIKNFETDVSNFGQKIGDIANSVVFEHVNLKGSNMPIIVKSLVGEIASLRTSNGPIEGSFNTSTVLDIHTSNAPITVDVGLFHTDGHPSPKVSLKTSNGPIGTNLSLYTTSDSGIGGVFEADIHTSNSPLGIKLVQAPVDHTLHMKAHTSNSPVRAALHPTFEGTFRLSSSRFFRPTVHTNSSIEDPAGKDRRRSVDIKTIGSPVVEGLVRWLPAEREQHLGHVEISTSNLGLDLSL